MRKEIRKIIKKIRRHRFKAVTSSEFSKVFLIVLLGAAAFLLTADSNSSQAQPPTSDNQTIKNQVEVTREISIPTLKINAPIINLKLNPDRTLQVPKEFNEVGWYEGSSVPGETGIAIMVGHYDSYTGPAVFYDLKKLKPEDIITIRRSDGKLVNYIVEKLDEYHYKNFPSDVVYGQTNYPSLRLLTCSGQFLGGRYSHNLVVYARLQN